MQKRAGGILAGVAGMAVIRLDSRAGVNSEPPETILWREVLGKATMQHGKALAHPRLRGRRDRRSSRSTNPP